MAAFTVNTENPERWGQQAGLDRQDADDREGQRVDAKRGCNRCENRQGAVSRMMEIESIRQPSTNQISNMTVRMPIGPSPVPRRNVLAASVNPVMERTREYMTFAKGASLKDPSGLFNSSLEGNTRRAIDFHEGEKINEKALKTLVRAAVALNKSKANS